jgi:hypothetical protein
MTLICPCRRRSGANTTTVSLMPGAARVTTHSPSSRLRNQAEGGLPGRDVPDGRDGSTTSRGRSALGSAVTTIRIARRRQFVRLDSRAVNDERLSFRARGVLAWLLDKPDDWTVNADAISRQGAEGRDAIRRALGELEAAGYLVRKKWRGPGGTWIADAVLYEHPEDAQPQRETSAGQPQRETSAGEPGLLLTTQLTMDTQPPLASLADPAPPASRSKRATQLPDGFEPSQDMLLWAREHHPSVDTVTETQQFADYHTARGSTFKDWPAAWRTWMRNADKFQKNGRGAAPKQQRPIMTDRTARSGVMTKEEIWG